MAETPVGYFPDVRAKWGMKFVRTHATEIETSFNGREQRRKHFAPNGYRVFSAPSESLDQVGRRAVEDFEVAKSGAYQAFYFFNPIPQLFTLASSGALASDTMSLLPFSESTIYDVRVAGLSQAFTQYKLRPRVYGWPVHLINEAATTYINAGTSSTLKPTGNFTLTAWVFVARQNPDTNHHYVFYSETSLASGFTFVLLNTGSLLLRTNRAGADSTAISSLSVPFGSWQFIAATLSGTTATFYINGGAAGTVTGIQPALAASTSMTLLMNAARWTAQDLRLYNVALSAAQIADVYRQTTLPPNTNLQGHWLINEGAGVAVTDWSGRGNNGTIANPGFWTGGEDIVAFSSAQSGSLAVTLLGRERMAARFANDAIEQSFIPSAGDVRTSFAISVKEVY
jgi:hypothetical protein